MGLSIDWSREFATCDKDYYHHQQKLFKKLLMASIFKKVILDISLRTNSVPKLKFSSNFKESFSK